MTYLASKAKRQAHVRASTTKSGSARECAKAIGVPYSTLLNWRMRGSVPVEHCADLVEWSGGYFDPTKVRRDVADVTACIEKAEQTRA